MFRCGLIDDGAVPGTCSMMPAGQRVLTKITSLIDAEMHRAGAHRISLPLLVPESAMRTSGMLPVWYGFKLKYPDAQFGLSYCWKTAAVTAYLSSHG